MRVTQKMWHRSLLDGISRSYNRMTSIDMRRRILTASDDPAGSRGINIAFPYLQHYAFLSLAFRVHPKLVALSFIDYNYMAILSSGISA